ncbi:MBL fold metallo-hydrolase [Defluviicoccus vanus]|uniref:MBL fold metallo-hydrolase n=1 Tax=Defluviicoccus vanus TaxID=111831 RepID=A0A7H1N181_9PROT|nr:MBL fold metallo-hydrolase [Defluviicoccus vanus]QNT69467.1 MBL fold metallo-hydrolase [Defluviicoccus vanus]
MLFRQLFEPETSTYTYLLGCVRTGEAILIDPVLETIDRDLHLLQSLGLRLVYSIETHVHADHLTAAWELRRRRGCQVVYPAAEGVACADVQLSEEEPLTVGALQLWLLHTPGHTVGSACYLLADRAPPMLFSGDALLIEGCGRTDLQGGDAAALYASVHARILSLPDDTLVYPGHDYNQRRVSSVGQERLRNPRLGDGKTLGEFIAIMTNLNLPLPNQINTAVVANRCCGGEMACKHGAIG